MKIRDYRESFVRKLTPLYDQPEAEQLFYLLLEHHQGLRRIDLALDTDKQFLPEEVRVWDALQDQLSQYIPVQYIIGAVDFYGIALLVNPHTLIPRPETEELVRWILDENKDAVRILDMGTGSGAIAIALAVNLPQAQLTAIDISEDALATARENALKNGAKIDFIQQDILQAQRLLESYELIVSNPPYVRMREKNEIRANVLEHEPHLALFVPDENPLVFYQKIAGLAVEQLSPGGWLYFEINQYLGQEMIALLKSHGFAEVVLRKDLYGNDRMIRARKPYS